MKHFIITLFLLALALPADAQKDLVSDKTIRFAERLDPAQCEKERDNKTPMALLHVEIPGLAEANITEENNFIKGSPRRTANGWDIWVTTNTKKKICLKIYTDAYKPLIVRANEKLESAKRYVLTASVPPADVNAGKVYVLVDVKEPCEFSVRKGSEVVERITFTESKRDTLLHLPYGGYTYSATASNRYTNEGSLILSGAPIERSITLRSNQAKLTLFSEHNTRLFVDGKEQVAVGDTTVIDKKMGSMKYRLYETQHEIGSRHTLLAKGPEDIEDQRDITLKPGTNVCDMHMSGTLEITKSKRGATDAIIKQGADTLSHSIPHTVKPALGTYEVTFKKWGYEDHKETYLIDKRKNEVASYKFPRAARTFEEFGFSMFTYSPSAPFGLMAGSTGRDGRWGGYVSFKTSMQFWKSLRINKNAYTSSLRAPVEPNDWKDYQADPDSLVKKSPYRYSITAGVMYGINPWVYLYAGVGYGRYKTLYENPHPHVSAPIDEDSDDGKTYYKDRFFSTYNLKGFEVEGGIIINLRHVLLTAGWTHLLGSPTFGDFNVGIGRTIPKQ